VAAERDVPLSALAPERRVGEISWEVKQQNAASRVCMTVEPDDGGVASAERLPSPAGPPGGDGDGAEAVVGALYQATALGLIRLAYVMLGGRPSAEDVVQEAFCGLYRHWDRLEDADGAMYYVRASVLNGCRSVLRHREVRRKGLAEVRRRGLAEQPPTVSAEAVVLGGEEHEEVIRVLGRLPHRQREVVMLRFYCDLSDEQIARVMGIRPSTVRSTSHRALEALRRDLKETS
jgi:RNA polymerase sigma-70 factor (sigma-E family)